MESENDSTEVSDRSSSGSVDAEESISELDDMVSDTEMEFEMREIQGDNEEIR